MNDQAGDLVRLRDIAKRLDRLEGKDPAGPRYELTEDQRNWLAGLRPRVRRRP